MIKPVKKLGTQYLTDYEKESANKIISGKYTMFKKYNVWATIMLLTLSFLGSFATIIWLAHGYEQRLFTNVKIKRATEIMATENLITKADAYKNDDIMFKKSKTALENHIKIQNEIYKNERKDISDLKKGQAKIYNFLLTHK